MKAIILVIDGFGVGEAPDAADFGDVGADTYRHVKEQCAPQLPHLSRFGLDALGGEQGTRPVAAYGKMTELSRGKDTTVGHWEIAGVVTETPFPTFPNGFPPAFIDRLEEAFGTKVLCNRTYSGTEVIKDYGKEHLATGYPIVYTSADSVLQIATHKSVYSVDQLYALCEKARALCVGEYAVGRIIARPFDGDYPFARTAERKDFSVDPTGETLLDVFCANDLASVAVGKIENIFNGRGITRSLHTTSNLEGLNDTVALVREPFDGLVFVNLVDTDMKYGHRRDASGYADALKEIDGKLPEIVAGMAEEDVLFITGDHGCDPTFTRHTDHTREYTPLLIYGKRIVPQNLGTLSGMDVISDTVREQFSLPQKGKSLWKRLIR